MEQVTSLQSRTRRREGALALDPTVSPFSYRFLRPFQKRCDHCRSQRALAGTNNPFEQDRLSDPGPRIIRKLILNDGRNIQHLTVLEIEPRLQHPTTSGRSSKAAIGTTLQHAAPPSADFSSMQAAIEALGRKRTWPIEEENADPRGSYSESLGSFDKGPRAGPKRTRKVQASQNAESQHMTQRQIHELLIHYSNLLGKILQSVPGLSQQQIKILKTIRLKEWDQHSPVLYETPKAVHTTYWEAVKTLFEDTEMQGIVLEKLQKYCDVAPYWWRKILALPARFSKKAIVTGIVEDVQVDEFGYLFTSYEDAWYHYFKLRMCSLLEVAHDSEELSSRYQVRHCRFWYC